MCPLDRWQWYNPDTPPLSLGGQGVWGLGREGEGGVITPSLPPMVTSAEGGRKVQPPLQKNLHEQHVYSCSRITDVLAGACLFLADFVPTPAPRRRSQACPKGRAAPVWVIDCVVDDGPL